MNKLKEIVSNLRKIREYRITVRVQEFEKEEIFWTMAKSKAQAEEQILHLLENQGRDCSKIAILKTKPE